MNRSALIAALRHKTKYTRREIARFLDALTAVLQDELAGGGHVFIRRLGRFEIRQRGPWKIKHPETGEPYEIPIKWGVHFTPCPEMRDRVEFSPKLYKEEDLLERYGIKKETDNGEVRSGDRSQESGKGKARKRFPWSR